VTLAKGSLHDFKNTGPKPARMLIVVTSAGLENFFREVGREVIDGETEPVSQTPEDIQKLLHAAPKYGIEVEERRIVLTFDLDFGEILAGRPDRWLGIARGVRTSAQGRGAALLVAPPGSARTLSTSAYIMSTT
jgi:hypothetical protein